MNGKVGAGGSDAAGSVVGSVVWSSADCMVGSSSSADCGRESLNVCGSKPSSKKTLDDHSPFRVLNPVAAKRNTLSPYRQASSIVLSAQRWLTARRMHGSAKRPVSPRKGVKWRTTAQCLRWRPIMYVRRASAHKDLGRLGLECTHCGDGLNIGLSEQPNMIYKIICTIIEYEKRILSTHDRV